MFENRIEAGRALGRALLSYAGRDLLVLGLPRGGVPVAFEVADILAAPLDVWVVRKLGVPSQSEVGMGAIAEGPVIHVDGDLTARLGLSSREVLAVLRREEAEVRRRVIRFRRGRPAPEVKGKTVLLVDDGIATGGTARVAIQALRERGPTEIILAVPVASPQALQSLQPLVDDVVCLSRPRDFVAVGIWYEDFRPVPDLEVTRLLDLARQRREVESALAGRSRPALPS